MSHAGGREKTTYGGITRSQKRVLDWVKAYMDKKGIAPTHEEINAGLGFASPNAAIEHMRRLERQGWIRTERRKARAIWNLPTPDPHRPRVTA